MNKPRKLDHESESKRAFRAKVFKTGMTSGLLLLSLFLLWSLRSLFLPFLVGAFLAYMFRPFMNSLRHSWLPNGLRVVLLLSLFTGALSLGVHLIRKSLPDDRQKLELMVRSKYKFNEKLDHVMGINLKSGKGNWIYNIASGEIESIRKKINHLLSFNADEKSRFLAYLTSESPEQAQKYQQYFDSNQKMEALIEEAQDQSQGLALASAKPNTSLLKSLLDSLSTWVVMPLTFIFLLLDNGKIFRYFIRLIPNRYFEVTLTTIDAVDVAIGKYLRGTFSECALVGLTFIIGLIVIGIPFNIAITIGVLAGLTNAIPFLGPLIGLAVGLAYAMIAENISPLLPFISQDNLVIAVFGVVVVAQVLDNVIFQPMVLGSAVNLHPLVVIFGVLGGSILFGFAGMLLAVPTIVIFKVVIETLYREFRAYYII